MTDIDRLIDCPVLAIFGSEGRLAGLFDIAMEWQKRSRNLQVASLPGAHFFVDQYPDRVANLLGDFIGQAP